MNRKEYDKMRYQQNREERLRYAREYWTREGVKERVREWQRKRYQEIKEKGLWSL